MVEQNTLERKLRPDAIVFLTPQMTLEEAFGPMEDWILEIGSHRLMINPINGYWVYEDVLHDSWEATGFRAGEVLFYLDGEELAVKLNPEPPDWDEDNRFNLAEEFYLRLQKGLTAGIIDQETYSREVQALRFQDRSGSWWQVQETDGSWLTWVGDEWVEGVPDRETRNSKLPAVIRGFAALKERYFSLWQQRDEGELSPDKFQSAVRDLNLLDGEGTWWQICESNGTWLKWDGEVWVEAEPRF
jgi:hypothetical protein